MKLDRLTLSSVVVFPLITFCVAFIYSGNALNLLSVGIISLLIGLLAQRKKSAPDLIFIGIMNYVVGLQIISLSVWPEYLAYQDGAFSIVSATISTVDRSFLLLMAINFGWFSVLFFDRCNVSINSIKINSQKTHLIFFIGWFSFSIMVLVLSAIFLDVGIAGVESDFRYAGFLYYLFPADYLVIALSVGLGLKLMEFKKRESFLWLLIGIYLVVKIMCGWKSPLLNVVLAYAVGVYYSGEIKSVLKIVSICMMVIFLYVFLIKPVVEFVRTGESIISDDIEHSSNYNLLESRLTMGTLYGVAAIELGQSVDEVDIIYFLGDFINRIVPGIVFDIPPIDRIFTENILGQPSGIASTFAPGSLGMVEVLGGVMSAFFYGVFFRLLVLLITQWCYRAKEVLIKLLLLGGIPIFVVSLCTDGYTGGFEKLVVLGVVITIFLKTFDIITSNGKLLPARYQ